MGSKKKWTPTDIALTAGTGGVYGLTKATGLNQAIASGAKKLDPFKGPEKVKGMNMSKQAAQAEADVLAQQAAIASGEAPSTAAMQYEMAQNQAQRAGLAQAATARGVNPALAFRAANQATQIAQQDAGVQSAILAEEERRRAAEAIAQIAAGQRGVQLQTALANQSAATAQRGQNLQLLGGIGSSAMAASGGGKK